ncbi:hypothetical protein JVU11DRAFT_999 [Chiua virens]|nr:hypothetical protein JVU11DRAFT_999 [Chiua virens]
MVYDHDQCTIGTLFGLTNRLVLRAKNEVEAGLDPRYILVPYDAFARRNTPKGNLLPGGITYQVYTVDTDLGRLTGNSSLMSKSFLAYLHAKTSVDWKPDPLTGRTGIHEALSILQSAGTQSLLRLQGYPYSMPVSDVSARYPHINIAMRKAQYLNESLDSSQFDKDLLNQNLDAIYWLRGARRAAYRVPNFMTEDFNHKDCIPSISDTELGSIVCVVASVVFHCGTLWDPKLLEVLSMKVREVLREGNDCTRPTFQLLFALPTMAYCSSHPQAAFLSMLVAFAKGEQHLCGNPSSYADYNFLDGYIPTDKVLRHLIHVSRNADQGWDEEKTRDIVDAAVRCLRRTWPSDSIPTLLSLGLEPDIWDLKENLTRTLQREPAISCTTGIQTTHSNSTPPGPAPSPVSSSQYVFEPLSPVTLDRLFSNRRPPMLPNLTKLSIYNSHDGGCSSSASGPSPALARLYSFLRTSKTDIPFREQYVTQLHASARRVREEDEMMRGTQSYSVEELRRHFLRCKCKCTDALQILKESLSPTANPFELALHRSGEWPVVTVDTLLRCLATTSPIKLSKGWTGCLLSLALLLSELQRSRRLLRFALKGLEEELSKEIINEGCDGWTAEQFPDWLLIQLQGDFLIRRSQVNIALKMISPESGESTVMQVNMGEGKSSVIIPIVAAALANGHQLTRVVIPKALRQQMFYLLLDRLGGFANRPTIQSFFFPWFQPRQRARRPEDVVSLKLASVERQLPGYRLVGDLPSKSQSVYNPSAAFRSLRSLKGSYLADLLLGLCNSRSYLTPKEATGTPDAFQNNAHTASRASQYLNLQKWLHCHARDMVDESDETFHPRFQLIYTVGHQQHMDGYPDRWTITQQILKLVKRHASSMSKNLPDSIEYKLSQPGSFPYFRISPTSDTGRRLISLLLDDVMAGHLASFKFQHLSKMQRNAIRDFLLIEKIQPDRAEEVMEYAKQSRQSHLWGGTKVARRLLRSLALGPYTTGLAVPYRAKDVPAPRTQFGHPDITILFTCLSYYYSGLSEAQLRLSFQTLLDEDNPAAEYKLWTKDCGSASVPSTFQTFGEFNLESSEQWDKYLFPTFSRNQAAIDFYLSRVVFPKEGKEFPWKLAGSCWDLAEKKEHPMTGFSGTNDSRYLLPESVTQHDIEDQQGTNARVLGYLLQPENDFYMLVAHEDTKSKKTREFLKTVVGQSPQIRVLLDVGAQILDVSNRELAEEWLELSSSDTAGAIYFDEFDELNVLTRNHTILPLMASPLSQKLDRCVIYLDDAHTRGTDLKFPNGFRAAVTLGPKVTKDRLVQGCMRMRKLGGGHSVMFFAPLEVDLSIRSATHKKDPNIRITSADILKMDNPRDLV